MMKEMGIQIARIKELIAATFFMLFFSLGAPTFFMLVTLFLICSSYRWILIPYFIWIWNDRGSNIYGRRTKWIKNWKLWKHAANYFPTKIVKEGNIQLDIKSNYLFCCFPHGICPTGLAIALLTNGAAADQIFPFHEFKLCGLSFNLFIPFARELFLNIGVISCSAESIVHFLSAPQGGNVVTLLPGGAAEILYSKKDTYKLVLKKRKGFIKLSLKTGSPLVPVITFNEVNVLENYSLPSLIRVQEFLRRRFIYPLILFKGRYIICPNQVPLTVVVGQPIPVVKNETPTPEDVDELHQLFMTKLNELFENNKHKYIENADNIFLEFV